MENAIKQMKAGKTPMKLFCLVDGQDEIVGAFQFNADEDEAVGKTLTEVAELLFCMHAAMRGELTGGS